MSSPTPLKNKTLSVRNSIDRTPLRRRVSLTAFALALACFAPSPPARALTPAPDGGYPNANTAEGLGALNTLNTNTGGGNTAVGYFALQTLTAGSNNTAVGVQALNSNTGEFNTAIGAFALFNNTNADFNTATGDNALLSNTTGSNNTADGFLALENNKAGHDNIAVGFQALKGNTGGNNNIGLGSNAGSNLTIGSNNIDLGANVLGSAGEANTIRIGKQGTQKATFIAGVFGAAVTGSTVVVNSTGKLGVATSSARFKEGIKPMDKSSEAILALKPVTFRYKEELDPDKIPQFGLIAEEVEKVNPDLVGRDEDGKVNTVRYEAVNAMLLNEFLKEYRKVKENAFNIATQVKNLNLAGAFSPGSYFPVQGFNPRISNRETKESSNDSSAYSSRC